MVRITKGLGLKGSYNAIFVQVNMNLWGLNENFVIYFYFY